MAIHFKTGGAVQIIYTTDDEQHSISFPQSEAQYNSTGFLTDLGFRNLGLAVSAYLAKPSATTVKFQGVRHVLREFVGGKVHTTTMREQFFETEIEGQITAVKQSAAATLGIVYKGRDDFSTPKRNVNHTLKLFVGHENYHVKKIKKAQAGSYAPISDMLIGLSGTISCGFNAGSGLLIVGGYVATQINGRAQKAIGH